MRPDLSNDQPVTCMNMKTYHHLCTIKIPCVLFLTVLLFGFQAQGQINWTRISDGTRNWSDASNWDTLPDNPESESVTIRQAGTNQTIMFGGDQLLTGGLNLGANTSNSGTLTLNLAGHRLTVDGGANGRLLLDPLGSTNASANENMVIVSNGVLQVGGSQATSLILGGVTGNSYAGTSDKVIRMVFAEGSTLDTANTASIEVATNNSSRLQNLLLDLSGASLVSGSDWDTLRVSGSVSAGVSTTTGPAASRHKLGAVHLGVLSTLEIGQDLVLGQNFRTNDSNTNAYGSLSFSVSEDQGPLDMSVGQNLLIGIGPGASGDVFNAPQDLRLSIASEESRGLLQIGYKTGNAVGDTSGVFVSSGGTLEAWLSSLSIGHSTSNNGVVTGTFNFQSSVLSTLDVEGAAVIGKGVGAVGDLRLHSGNARSQTLEVGVTSDTVERSLLRLDNTLWAVENSLHVGANGDIEVLLYGQSAGLDLQFSNLANLTLDDGAKITLWFEEEAGMTPIWGMRMAGDHLSYFENLVSNGLLVAAGSYGGEAILFSDGDYTWYGLQAIPEPSVAVLLAGVLLTGIVARNRILGRLSVKLIAE